jgi:hypothetical protein
MLDKIRIITFKNQYPRPLRLKAKLTRLPCKARAGGQKLHPVECHPSWPCRRQDSTGQGIQHLLHKGHTMVTHVSCHNIKKNHN